MPIATHKKLDARVVKTLNSIEQAFLAVLSEKPYDSITIADILERANINRTTFYKYYNNKNELTHHLVESLKSDFFIPVLEKRYKVSWDEFSQYAPELLAQNHAKLRVLWHITTPTVSLRQDCYELIKQKYLDHMTACPNIHPDENLVFQAHVFASMSLAMMDELIEKDTIPPAEHTHRDLERVMNNVLHKCN